MRILTGVLCLSLNASAFAAERAQQLQQSGAKYVGAQGCRSSSCHGGAGPKREQYIIWSQRDFHTKAYAVLITARSQRIAETLGAAPAQTNARCTICHAPFANIAQTRLATGIHAEEGVSCETCHGAAGAWQRGHTRPDWTYATRVGAGMRDLRSLYVRANTCVACHQNVERDVLAAGHPQLFFELDGQSQNEPRHWREEGEWNGPRAWLTGQAVALRETSWAATRGDNNETQLDALLWILGKAAAADPAMPRLPAGDFAAVQSAADAIARRAATWTWSAASVRTLLNTLLGTHREFVDDTVRKEIAAARAKRLVLAIDRLATALQLRLDLKQLWEDVKLPETFNASAFAAHLREVESNALSS